MPSPYTSSYTISIRNVLDEPVFYGTDSGLLSSLPRCVSRKDSRKGSLARLKAGADLIALLWPLVHHGDYIYFFF